jgi:hypothetical protein
MRLDTDPRTFGPSIPWCATLVLLLQGCSSLPARDDDLEAIEAQLTRQADDWDQPIVRKDRSAIEANMADDFRQIDAYGNVESKASFVSGLLSPDLRIATSTSMSVATESGRS